MDELSEAIGYADISLQQIGIKLLEDERPAPPFTLPPTEGGKSRQRAMNDVGLEIGGVGNLLTLRRNAANRFPEMKLWVISRVGAALQFTGAIART